MPTIDGSTWNPWAHRLLFTAEKATAKYAATPAFPSSVTDLRRVRPRRVRRDPDATTATSGSRRTSAARKAAAGSATCSSSGTPPPQRSRVANSFLYRYVPDRSGHLANGKLQALQVMNRRFGPSRSKATALTSDQDLHTYGNMCQTRWVTIHDTAVDGTRPFNANTLAKTPCRLTTATSGLRSSDRRTVFPPGTHFSSSSSMRPVTRAPRPQQAPTTVDSAAC